MRNIFLVTLLLFVYSQLRGQSIWKYERQSSWKLSFGLGSSSYYGELKESDLGLDLRGVLSAWVGYQLTDHFRVRGELTYYRISGADSDNGPESSIFTRNLSFVANNFELSVQGVINLFPEDPAYIKPSIFNPIAFIGVAVTTQNPKAELNGETFNLRKLRTEGNAYSSLAFVIPFGVGMKINVTKFLNFAVEGGLRYTFTDYLDDVSTQYLDNASFSDPNAQALADIGPEIGLNVKPA